jgi:hypothetical protein
MTHLKRLRDPNQLAKSIMRWGEGSAPVEVTKELEALIDG